ncbi:hypothetical protein HU200_015600 [Digitaria exilis]|uniref:SCP domain-containing protein n=1 Tax=Digitaria exilis TaxID=1010633 RepID=A0A835F8I4_9POAL|nr:hypothetical protein HU200_015600 [Digitaria exilis]CAB3456298.1 unnamed protein product [Digitaria exilis]
MEVTWLALALAMAAAGVAAQNTAQDFVNLHNSPRADVAVAGVTWNATVAAYAQGYADQRAAGDCQLVHSGGPYGENLFWGSSGYAWAASDAVGAWVAEKQYYNHATNTCSAPSGKSCGHYTQVVWRASVSIGCARVVCSNNGGVVIICNYSPPGNVIGQSPY